jgi:hypothetical protein
VIQLCEQIIRENWSNWYKTPPPRRLFFLKITGNPLAEGRVTFIVFKDRNRTPSLIVKGLRSKNSLQALQKEHNTLYQLHSLLGGMPGIPVPLWCGCINEQWFSIETAFSGKLMGNMRSPWIHTTNKKTRDHVIQHFTRSFQWLGDFHLKSKTDIVQASHGIVEKLLIESMLDESPVASYPPDICRAIEYVLKQVSMYFSSADLPLVCEHGDFWAGNIYLIGDKIGVIDWADAKFSRLPVLDAAFFAVSYTLGFAPVGDNKFWMFENLVSKKSWYYQLVAESFRNYHQQIGLPTIDPFYLLGLSLLRRYTTESKRPKDQTPYQWMLDHWMKTALEQSS